MPEHFFPNGKAKKESTTATNVISWTNQSCLVSGLGKPAPADIKEEKEREEKSEQDKIETVGTDGAGETRSKF